MDDFSIEFTSFEPEMDLNEDIAGSPSITSNRSENTGNDLPENFWSQASSGFNLIPNNDLSGTVEDPFGQNVSENEQKLVYQKVYRMGMQGVSALELEKILKLSFSSQDFRTKPHLQGCLFLLPMMGKIFWSCWAYKSEEDAKTELRRKNGLKPIFANEYSRCNNCQFRNALSTTKVFCSKLGLPLFSMNFSDPPPASVISHLRIAGYLATDKRDYSWDDIRAALIFPLKNNPVRHYEAYTPPRKEVLPGAQYRRVHREMNKLNHDLRDMKESEAQTRLQQTVIFPIIVKVQEMILRNRQNDSVANDAIRGMLLPEGLKEKSVEFVKALQQDILLWAAIQWYVPPYKKCDDANKFLRANHLRIPYSRVRPECGACIENKKGYCKRLESRLVSSSKEILLTDRLCSIEFIGNDRGINRGIIDYCKQLEGTNPKSGLEKLRVSVNTAHAAPVYTGAGIQDLSKLPVGQLDNETCAAWIFNTLKTGNSIFEIKRTMRQVFGDRKGERLVQDVIYSRAIVPTDSNELCLTDYTINSAADFGRLNRCDYCPSLDEPYCKKFNKILMLSSTDVPVEVHDIVSYFKDLPRDIEVRVNPERCDKPLDIEMENPGEFLPVDVRVEKPLDEQRIWYEAQRLEMMVDAPPPIEFEEGLDIDMGKSGEGMELGNELI